MTDHTTIEAAGKRLARALDALEAAVDQRLETDRHAVRLSDQLHAFDHDRAKLACDLDAQTARVRQLENANRDIARRLDAAMDNIRSVLDTQDR